MSIFKKLFGKTAQIPVNEMTYDAVWDEFKRTVPYRDGIMMITVLEQPDHADAYNWLKPGTTCPMAKSFARSIVDYFRNPQGDPDEFGIVYQAESDENWSTPPESSLKGVADMVGITGIMAKVLYRETPGGEWKKIEIRPGE